MVQMEGVGDPPQQDGRQADLQHVDEGEVQGLGQGEGRQVGGDLRRDDRQQVPRPVATWRQQQGGQQDAIGRKDDGDLRHGRGPHAHLGAEKVAQAGGEGKQPLPGGIHCCVLCSLPPLAAALAMRVGFPEHPSFPAFGPEISRSVYSYPGRGQTKRRS